jgi:polyphosphate glucokinase
MPKRVPRKTAASTARPHPVTLAIDIGGTGLKALLLDPRGNPLTDRLRVETPHPATPEAVLSALLGLVAALKGFDRISVGFPGVVFDGIIQTAPNLDSSWSGFRLANVLSKRLRKPARVLNDAGVQGHGVIEGKGLEMVLTLGTGLGCALFYDGTYIPNLELAHHPFRGNKTYEDYLGVHALEKVGKKKWSKHVAEAVAQIEPVWNPDRIFIGGGNAKHLSINLPPHVQITSNEAGLIGGIALWRS